MDIILYKICLVNFEFHNSNMVQSCFTSTILHKEQAKKCNKISEKIQSSIHLIKIIIR